MSEQRIVFYDSECGFCQKWILFFLAQDKHARFLFAPLNGKTAQIELAEWLKTHSAIDSLVFLEKDTKTSLKKIFYWSRAVFKIFWYLGSFWRVIGIFSFLPSFLLMPSDFVYRYIAKKRRSLFCSPAEMARLKQFQDRFLP